MKLAKSNDGRIYKFLAAIAWSGIAVVVITLVRPEVLNFRPDPGVDVLHGKLLLRMFLAVSTIAFTAALGALLTDRFFMRVSLRMVIITFGIAFVGSLFGGIMQIVPFGSFLIMLLTLPIPLVSLLLFLYAVSLGLPISIIGPKYARVLLAPMLIVSIIGGMALLFLTIKHDYAVLTMLGGWYGLSLWSAIAILLQPEKETEDH